MEIKVKVKRELFRFSCEQDWINRAQKTYSTCGVRKGMYLTMDSNNHVLHMGRCFMEATKAKSYPVIVYELETNWTDL